MHHSTTFRFFWVICSCVSELDLLQKFLFRFFSTCMWVNQQRRKNCSFSFSQAVILWSFRRAKKDVSFNSLHAWRENCFDRLHPIHSIYAISYSVVTSDRKAGGIVYLHGSDLLSLFARERSRYLFDRDGVCQCTVQLRPSDENDANYIATVTSVAS